MTSRNIEWLLDCVPRPVQEEAILRAFYGYKSADNRDDAPRPLPLPHAGNPAVGYGYFLEMRLGKTPTMLNEMLLLEKHNDIRRRVILAPNTYKNTWVQEFNNFGLLTPVKAFETSKIGQSEEFIDENPDDWALIVNYEALIYGNVNQFLHKLITQPGTIMVADESIKIKNRASQITKAAMNHAIEADFVRILTGLPFTQGPQDLYSQLRFIRELNGRNFYAFRNRYCKMGGFKGKKIVGVDEEFLPELQGIIEGTAFVAKRKDWGKITEPEFYSMSLDLSEKQLKHYIEMDQEFITILESGEEISVDQVISKMLKLQQISSGFVYDEHGNIVELMDPMKTAKMKALLELLEDEIDEKSKVIIPYHYSASGDILLKALAKYNPSVIRSGQWMKKEGRDVDEEKRRFNENPDVRVILLQIQAGKYGHTLVGAEGMRCTHMLFYENTYSLDDRTQIEARNTAETQDWVNVYMDFVSSPVEANAAKALQRKEDLVSAVLGTFNPNKEVKAK